MGRLEAIWIKRARRGHMDSVQAAHVVARKGIVGNANQGGRRNVTIIEREVWERALQQLGTNADPSARRANFMVSGTPLKNSRGQILRIGECHIQIMGELKPCKLIDETVPGIEDTIYDDWQGGAYGIVLNDGEIRVGDEVKFQADRN